jgi:hypothetical protein
MSELFGAKGVCVIGFLLLGLLFNTLVNWGWITGRRPKRLGPLFVSIAIGLAIPFSAWEWMGLYWWSGVPISVVFFACARPVYFFVLDMKKPKKTSSRR